MAMRKLGRPTAHRKAMLQGMVVSLIENERIETTVTRAKELRSLVEKIITKSKSDDLHSKKQVYSFISPSGKGDPKNPEKGDPKENVCKKLFTEIGPRYSERNGGYTRIIRIGPRRGDAAEMAIIELV